MNLTNMKAKKKSFEKNGKKLCTKCNKWRSIDNFSKVNTYSMRRNSRCKLCLGIMSREKYFRSKKWSGIKD